MAMELAQFLRSHMKTEGRKLGSLGRSYLHMYVFWSVSTTKESRFAI
jgi:hypothetical protein